MNRIFLTFSVRQNTFIWRSVMLYVYKIKFVLILHDVFSFHFLHVIIAEIWYVGMRLSKGHVQEYITHTTHCTWLSLPSAQHDTGSLTQFIKARALES